MSQSNVSNDVERIATSLRKLADDPMDRFKAKELAGDLEKLAEPRGGVELARVCSECGVILEDDEFETLVDCPNCGQLFYELD